MPMFDDPGKALRQLEEELLAEEADHAEEFMEDSPVNYAVDFGRMAYADETLDDDAVFWEEDCKSARKAKKNKRNKGTAGLKFIIFLELVGIALVIGWWLKWLN